MEEEYKGWLHADKIRRIVAEVKEKSARYFTAAEHKACVETEFPRQQTHVVSRRGRQTSGKLQEHFRCVHNIAIATHNGMLPTGREYVEAVLYDSDVLDKLKTITQKLENGKLNIPAIRRRLIPAIRNLHIALREFENSVDQ
ncbi:MAG TPA: hypothetical protein VNT79_06995 [Phycisphaerae bacterium]|nr:hypothetical protein [Phycisphaerae bacterium]